MKQIMEFKLEMARNFEMSDLRKLMYYLGLEVFQDEKGIIIKQESYAKKILTEINMENSIPRLIPREPNAKLSKAEEEADADQTLFRKVVGCLRYLLHTRPDMSFAVGIVSRYMSQPKVSHMTAIKEILRYLRGTITFGIKYSRGKERNVTGYSDSSHNIDPDDGRSTTGHVFYYGSAPITWCSQKQTTVALSSCEAEYMAASAAACQAVWLRNLMIELTGRKMQEIALKIDNTSAIALAKNPVFHSRSKHIKTRYHYIRECIENGDIVVEHVNGSEQRADILTKGLAKVKFQEMRKLLGVEDFPFSATKIRE